MKTSNPPVTKRSLYIKIASATFIISLFLSLFSTVIANPTASHRQVSRDIQTQLQTDFFATENNPDLDSSRVDALMDTSENKYSEAASFLLGTVQLVISVYIAYRVYYLLRTKKITKNPVSTTTLMVIIPSTIALTVSVVIGNIYFGIAQASIVDLAGITAVSFIAGLIFIYLVTLVIQSRYNKKHSFAIE